METNPVLTHFFCVLNPDPSSYFSYIFCTYLFFHTFLKYLFVCRQMFPQMKFRLTGLDPKVSQSIASGTFSPLVVGQILCKKLYLQDMFSYPFFLIAGQFFALFSFAGHVFYPHFFIYRPSTFSSSTLLPMTTIATSSTTGNSNLQGVPKIGDNGIL